MGLCHSYATNTDVIYEAVAMFWVPDGHKWSLDSGDGTLSPALLYPQSKPAPPPTQCSDCSGLVRKILSPQATHIHHPRRLAYIQVTSVPLQVALCEDTLSDTLTLYRQCWQPATDGDACGLFLYLEK